MRVIMKIEMREIKFSCGVIAWIFFLIFYFSKIEREWLAKDSFSAKNQKDMLYDGIMNLNGTLLQHFLFKDCFLTVYVFNILTLLA